MKYSKEFNSEAQNIVKNYNAKVKRARNAGIKRVPETVKLRELKALNKTRSELNRELNRLKSFERSTLNPITTKGGATTSSFELKTLKNNLAGAREFFASQVERRKKRDKKFPAERLLLVNAQEKLKLINKEIDELKPEEFRSFVATVREYRDYPAKRAAGYRGYLSEVENVMNVLGYPKSKIDELLNKFNKLNPDQFFYAYDKFPLIDRIYELADSPIYGEIKLNTTDDDATDLINTLIEEADDIIKEAIENVD